MIGKGIIAIAILIPPPSKYNPRGVMRTNCLLLLLLLACMDGPNDTIGMLDSFGIINGSKFPIFFWPHPFWA
jgi:hypothetical protein